MRVFLIHGMGRTPASMGWLALRLRLAGHSPSLFGYSVTFEKLAAIAERFLEHVQEGLGDGASTRDGDGKSDGSPEPYAVIGHSLGGIITRLASPGLPDGFSRFVMLAPPNRSPAIARELQDHPLFVALTRDAGQKLCDEDFYDALPVPDVPSLIIAGTRGVDANWHPLGGRTNDAIVSVDEARLDGIPLVTVPGIHSFLMNRADVFEISKRFLADGVHRAEP